MTLFLRRGRPRLGAGFRPALVRHGQKRPSAIAEPKMTVEEIQGMGKRDLKNFLRDQGIDFPHHSTKNELLVLALGA